MPLPAQSVTIPPGLGGQTLPDWISALTRLHAGRVSDPSQDRFYAAPDTTLVRGANEAQAIPLGDMTDPISQIALGVVARLLPVLRGMTIAQKGIASSVPQTLAREEAMATGAIEPAQAMTMREGIRRIRDEGLPGTRLDVPRGRTDVRARIERIGQQVEGMEHQQATDPVYLALQQDANRVFQSRFGERPWTNVFDEPMYTTIAREYQGAHTEQNMGGYIERGLLLPEARSVPEALQRGLIQQIPQPSWLRATSGATMPQNAAPWYSVTPEGMMHFFINSLYHQ